MENVPVCSTAVSKRLQWAEWCVGMLEAAYVAGALFSGGYDFDGKILCGVLGVLLITFLPSVHKERFAPLWTSSAVPVGALCIPLCFLALLAQHSKSFEDFLCTTTVYARTLAVHARIGLATAGAFAISRRILYALHPVLMCVLGTVISIVTSVLVFEVEERLAIIGSLAFFITVMIIVVRVGDVSFSLGDCITISHIASAILTHFACLPAFSPSGFRLAQLFDFGLLKSDAVQAVYTSWTLKTETIACIVTAVVTMLFVALCCVMVPKQNPTLRAIALGFISCVCMAAIHIVFDNYSHERYGIIVWTLNMLFVQHIRDSVGVARIVLCVVYVLIMAVAFLILYVVFYEDCSDGSCGNNSIATNEQKDTVDDGEETVEKEDVVPAVPVPAEEEKPKPSPFWRKYFHLIALLMFVPGLLAEPTMVFLPVTYVACAFVVLECLRACTGPKESSVLSVISSFYSMFTGDQDHGMITSTHICLFVGIVLPCWLSTCTGTSSHWLAPFSGLVVVGVGDAAAALFGRLFGTHKWLGCSKKSIEGTVAGIAFAFLFCVFLWLCNKTPDPSVFLDLHVWIAVIGSMLQEAFITQIDNLALPIHFFVLLSTPLPHMS